MCLLYAVWNVNEKQIGILLDSHRMYIAFDYCMSMSLQFIQCYACRMYAVAKTNRFDTALRTKKKKTTQNLHSLSVAAYLLSRMSLQASAFLSPTNARTHSHRKGKNGNCRENGWFLMPDVSRRAISS